MAESLQDYLIDIDGNKGNLGSLVKLLKEKRNKCVCFLGAGLPSQFKGVPDAEELAKSLNKTYKKRMQFKDDLKGFCSKLYKVLQEGQRCSFYREVFKMIDPSDNSGTQTELCKIFNSFVTLNFKDSIELAFERQHKDRGLKLEVFYFQYPKDSNDPSITYLHGHEQLGSAILRKEDYKYYYSFLDKPGQNLVLFNSYKYLLENRNVVFCAISMEIVLAKTLEKLKSESTQFGDHFWIVDEETWTIFVRRHFSDGDEEEISMINKNRQEIMSHIIYTCQDRFGLRPVIYKDDKHRFLASLCAEVGRPTSDAIVEPSEDSMGEVK